MVATAHARSAEDDFARAPADEPVAESPRALYQLLGHTGRVPETGDCAVALRDRPRLWESRHVGGAIKSRRVISMGDPERVASFEHQPGAAAFEFFKAIDPRVDAPPRDRWADVPVDGDGRRSGLSLGQQGCVFSHTEVMRQFLDGAPTDDDWLLVVEDDVEFGPGFGAAADAAIAAGPKADLILLSDCWRCRDIPYRLWRRDDAIEIHPSLRLHGTGRRLVRVEPRIELGTAAYLVSGRGARLLVEHANTGIQWVADDHRRFQSWGLRIAMVVPTPAMPRAGLASGITGGLNDRIGEPRRPFKLCARLALGNILRDIWATLRSWR